MRFQCRIGPEAHAARATLSAAPTPPGPDADACGFTLPRPARDVLARGAVAGAAAIAALSGCSTLEPAGTTMRPRIEPVLAVQHSQESSRTFVAMGEYFETTRQWDRAVEAHRKAIQLDGGNVEAYNGLGVALAQLGRTIDAEGTLRQAVALAPGKAHIRNNLGYVLLLSGKPREAVPEFRAAVEIDPANRIAMSNLRDAVARSAISRYDPSAPSDAASLDTRWASAQPPANTPALAAAPAAPAAALAPAPAVAAAPVDAWQWPPQPAAPRQAWRSAKAPTVAAGPAGRLELSNGNGVSGMAARVNRWLAAQGLPADRLTNQRRYDLRRSVIQYAKGQEALAQRVARALPPGIVAEAIARPVAGADVRLVLGRDWMEVAACLERENGCAAPATMVALATPR